MEFEGIVIKNSSFRDFDGMITVLTEHGLKSFLAKGIRKFESKNGPTVNLLTKSLFEVYKGKEGDFLRSGKIINSFPKQKDTLEGLAFLNLISEITNNFIQGNETNYIYNLLNKVLEEMNNGFDVLTLGLIYFAQVLKNCGFALEVDKCIKCGSKEEMVHLSYENGGFICKKCFGNNKIVYSVTELKVFRYIFKVSRDSINKVKLPKEECLTAYRLLFDFVNYIIQVDLKSKELILSI